MSISAQPHPVSSARPLHHSAVREGVIAGALGASVVAVWFLGVDVIAGHPLRTPELLGRALISVLGPLGAEGAFTYIAAYTVFHYVAFALIGIFLVKAAHDYNAREAIGLDGVLQKLANHSYGSWLLGIGAAGLLAYAVFCLFEARYRKV